MAYNYSESDKKKIEQAKREEPVLAKYGIAFCTLEQDKYPSSLRTIASRPPVIYYRGNIDIVNNQKSIAVIGSRKFSEAGAGLSYHAGKIVAEERINLVNGLALGCDTEALKGALSVGGKCIAILPCGLEQIQPKSNHKLADEILEMGGCLLSEYPVGTEVKNFRYVERDRLQSGISQGILVVEAEKKSGTMHTADFATKQFKRLACYYHKLLEASSGNQYLEETGKASVLKSEEDLYAFIREIKDEASYEQMSLF